MSGWILGALSFIEPGRVDYVPEQPASAVLGIRLLTGPIPAVFFIAGIIVLSFYPITKEVYAEIMEKVKKREEEAGAATSD
jgi:GPH family glycoside/pentoside/hexuronide:cation symporter